MKSCTSTLAPALGLAYVGVGVVLRASPAFVSDAHVLLPRRIISHHQARPDLASAPCMGWTTTERRATVSNGLQTM